MTITLRTSTGTVTFTEQQPVPVSQTVQARLRARRTGGEMINRVAANARSWMRGRGSTTGADR